MKSRVMAWLAASPLASALKVAAGQFLAWAVDNVAGLGFAPAVNVLIGAVLVVALNWVNPEDARYGR